MIAAIVDDDVDAPGVDHVHNDQFIDCHVVDKVNGCGDDGFAKRNRTAPNDGERC